MKGCKRIVLLLSVLALLVGVSAAPASAAHPVYLSLGDSWAFGFGASVPSETGYVPLLGEALQEEFDCSPSGKDKPNGKCQHLETINLAVGGATTPSLISGQLPEATEILQARNTDNNPRNDVEVVTLHIGGNDVTIPIISACLNAPGSPSCLATIQSEFAAYRTDLDAALSALREAAGPDTRILIGTYDNPIGTCVLGNVPGATTLADIVLEGGTGVPVGLHDIMREVAAQYDVEVVSVFGQLDPVDWLGGADCLHPDDSGYQKVADAFLEALAG